MAIIKLKTRENPYVQIDKTGINDPNLSWKATGLLTYLVGRPADWKIVLEHLASVKTDGITACKSALRELRSFNYCHYFELRQKGKVVETFYIIYEIPTPYSVELHNNILSEIEGIDDTYSLIYKKIEKEPKVENPLSAENPNFSDFSPKVENPLAVNPLADNQRLLIIDNTNNRKTNNKNHDMHDELDFFENLFKELGVNFTKTNKESVLRIRKHLSLKDTELYLRETYLALKENKEVKNIGALFSAKIKKEERQINSKKNKQIEEVKNQEPEKENNKNNFIEKVTENKEKENNTNDTIILFNSLEINEKIKIEEKALALLISEENVNKKFILQTKEKAPKIYITMLIPYISRLMGLNK